MTDGSDESSSQERLVQALIRLMKDRSAEGISVREIAAEAGVNHGLVHRHFGSKEGLVRAAAARLSDAIHAGDPTRPGMSAWSFEFLRRQPYVARLVARACLDGPESLLDAAAPPPERLEGIVEPIRAALERFGLDGELDPHVLNGLASAAFLGWFAFQPLLQRGFGLPDDADDQLAALLARLDALVGG